MTLRDGAGALFADLYELTMAQAYMRQGMWDVAVFEVLFRGLPRDRAYIVAAGLQDVLGFLEAFRFQDDDIEYLRGLDLFSGDFLEQLRSIRFTGAVQAVPEGTVVFPNEPIVQVIAPIPEAQLVETYVLNQIHVQSVIASKAARVVTAARGRTVVEFGSRRAHGTDAALKVARSSYVAGAGGTSNLLAGRMYGIPVFGTMAHSFVQAFDEETAAFQAFARIYPETTLLVDTYDTLRGVDRVIDLLKRPGERLAVGAIRLDSGDLDALSRAARAKLDAAGLRSVQIFASSDLDEHRIAALAAGGSPIDGFGVGTRLSTAGDAPALNMAYKLVEYGGTGRTKLSSHKVIYPGRKQVFRRLEGGVFAGDIVGHTGEDCPGEPLLRLVMRDGRRTPESDLRLDAARRRAREQIDALPETLRALDGSRRGYPVGVSAGVAGELERLRDARQ